MHSVKQIAPVKVDMPQEVEMDVQSRKTTSFFKNFLKTLPANR